MVPLWTPQYSEPGRAEYLQGWPFCLTATHFSVRVWRLALLLTSLRWRKNETRIYDLPNQTPATRTFCHNCRTAHDEELQLTRIDYSRKEGKEVGELRGDIGAITSVLAPFFRKPRSSHPKNEPFSQEMRLKIPLSSRGLNLPNSQVVESQLFTFLWNRYHPMAFWRWANSDKCFSSASYSRFSTPFNTGKRIMGLKSPRNLRTLYNGHLSIMSSPTIRRSCSRSRGVGRYVLFQYRNPVLQSPDRVFHLAPEDTKEKWVY